MGIPERKEREKEQRREEIINAAQKIFFEKGLQNATMDEIAEAAELSKGTLYLYYGSKEDLYLAVMLRGFDLLSEMCRESIAKAPSTVEALWRLGLTYYEFSQKHGNFFRMFHFFQNPGLHKQVSDEMMGACNTHTQSIWSQVIALIQRGIDEGILRSDLNPAEAAVILWSSSNAILVRLDNEADRWRKTLNVDLVNVFHVSNVLLLQSMMTEEARKKNASLFANNLLGQTA